MERKIVLKLQNWYANTKRKPLLLQGARQVGKTYSLLSFGKSNYKNTAYFSLEESGEYTSVFDRDLKPERIIKELSALSGITIMPDDTLIIFDEIQACEKALTSLKYFAEQAPEYHVVAAGSLLGVALKREKFSFPVGKVDMLNLFPMDFEEFLWAIGKKDVTNLIYESSKNYTPLSMHETAIDLYKKYLVVGGMPVAVIEYIEKQDFNFIKVAQNTLNNSYIADMAKYASAQETIRIKASWDSIPAQLSKENKKFQYKVIKSGARSKDYEQAIDWLTSAGMINKCINVSEGKMPLAAYADNDIFKIYMVDTGLLCSKFDIAANIVLHTPHSFDGFKGALCENYICQALITLGVTPYYWSSQGKAEVDFIIQDKLGNIIPIEAKSAENVKSKSLRSYRDIYKPEYVIRVSGKNFGFENGIKSIPLYALFALLFD
jgi:predicted AAA+ superfamily ATPase